MTVLVKIGHTSVTEILSVLQGYMAENKVFDYKGTFA